MMIVTMRSHITIMCVQYNVITHYFTQVSYDTDGTCQLVIQHTEPEHFGHYYVEAKNRYGVDVTHTELVQIGECVLH